MKVITLIAIVATIVVQVGATVDRSYCERLNGALYLYGGNFLGPGAELIISDKTRKWLRSPESRALESRAELSTALSWVMDLKICDSTAAEKVATIARCQPERFSRLASVVQSTGEFINGCLPADHWDKQCEHAVGGFKLAFAFASGRAGGAMQKRKIILARLMKFLDAGFITAYFEENQSERPTMDLADDGCQPKRSHTALADALGRTMGIERLGPESSEGMEKNLQENLFEPCISYVASMGELMFQAAAVARYRAGGESKFLHDISAGSFPNHLFRFKYCSKLVAGHDTLSQQLEAIDFSKFVAHL